MSAAIDKGVERIMAACLDYYVIGHKSDYDAEQQYIKLEAVVRDVLTPKEEPRRQMIGCTVAHFNLHAETGTCPRMGCRPRHRMRGKEGAHARWGEHDEILGEGCEGCEVVGDLVTA